MWLVQAEGTAGPGPTSARSAHSWAASPQSRRARPSLMVWAVGVGVR